MEGAGGRGESAAAEDGVDGDDRTAFNGSEVDGSLLDRVCAAESSRRGRDDTESDAVGKLALSPAIEGVDGVG